MRQKLIIFGNSAFAEIAAAYFARDTKYEVIGHVVDRDYMNALEVNGLPVYAFDSTDGVNLMAEATHFYAAATYTKQNDLRMELLARLEAELEPASYISPLAFVDPKAKIGPHSFIFENNVIQFGVTISKNCVLWSGNHIGHHSTIGENSFISSHVVISGHVTIGRNTFIGVNASIANNLDIGEYSWIGPGAIINKSIPEESMLRGEPSKLSPLKSKTFFKRA